MKPFAPLIVVVLAATAAVHAQREPRFDVRETTIASIHAEMKAGRLTCHALVAEYLRRIDAYDKRGPALNAIVQINDAALREADELDRRYKAAGPVGTLHCIPMIVKDNFETIGLQSAAGSLAMKGFVSTKDAFLVKRVKEAGALVLAKSNMAEWAFSPYETVSSILPGYTRNPYALDRVTAGSSGGTAAAIAASFGAVGLGSDTGNSIRGPSSHQALAGIRSTMGLTSRAGVVPLNLLADIAGPMGRTLEDAVTVFQVIVGEDPDDPITLAREYAQPGLRPGGRPPGIPDYRAALVRRRAARRANRRFAPGLRARHDGSRDRFRVHESARRHEGRRRRDRRSRAGGSVAGAPRTGRCGVRRLQVRHQPVSRGPRAAGAGPFAGRNRPLAPVPSLGAVAARTGAGIHRHERARLEPRARPRQTIASSFARLF